MHSRDSGSRQAWEKDPRCICCFFHYEFLAQSKPNTTKELNFDPSVDLSTYNKTEKG